MKVVKFRIFNYKSIVDSGDCFLEDDLTIFAGKNESGKTSILEALNDFNLNKNIAESAKPIAINNSLPEIMVTLRLESKELNKFYKTIGYDGKGESIRDITIIKSYPNKYRLSDNDKKVLGMCINLDESKKKLKTSYKELRNFYDNYLHGKLPFFNLIMDDLSTTENQLSTFINNYKKNRLQFIEDKEKRDDLDGRLKEFEKILKGFNSLYKFEKNIESYIPNFILFKSFDDILPNRIPFISLKTSSIIKDLKIISNLDNNLILSKDNRRKQKHKSELNLNFNKDYKQYWIQDQSEIKIEWDSDNLFFWIEEEHELYKPSERSKGKQWHLAFYIRVTARSKDKGTNIILIDEPGLFLHAAAQRDIYRKLLNTSKKTQVLFTTHSPYLMERDELHRVRLVIKKDRTSGTKIENKIHARADKETLTPILTAIGLGISDGIQNINQEKNIVVEGPSDYFYLQGFKSLLGKQEINIVFGGGSGNVGNVGAILTGWGCKVVYLFDNDKGRTDGSKNLKKKWYVNDEHIISVQDNYGAIEDLFSIDDFKKFVLQNNDVEINSSNSEFAKKEKLDKVLLSKNFYSLCRNGNIVLSNNTIKKIDELFDKINSTFETKF